MERTVWFGNGGGDGLRHACSGHARRLRTGGGARGSLRPYLPFCCADGKACQEPELQSDSCSPVCCREFFDRTNGSRIFSSIRDSSASPRPKSSVTLILPHTCSLFQLAISRHITH